MDTHTLILDFVRAARRANRDCLRMRRSNIAHMEGYDAGIRDEAMRAAKAIRRASNRCLDCKQYHSESQSFCYACRRKHDKTGTPTWLLEAA